MASKTQSLTQEIYDMIDRLQSRANNAVELMGNSLKRVDTLLAEHENNSASRFHN